MNDGRFEESDGCHYTLHGSLGDNARMIPPAPGL